ARRDPRLGRNEGAKQENALAGSARRDEESRNGLDTLGVESGFFEDFAADRVIRLLALFDHAGSHRLEPAAGLRQRRRHDLLDQIDRARLGIDQERRSRVTALEIEPPHLLAHAPVVALKAQSRLVDLEETIEHAPAADDLDLRHCGSFSSWPGSLPQLVRRSMVLTR